MDVPDEFCGCCKFFVHDYETRRGQSECHRHAPAVVPQPDGQGWVAWPPVGEAEWCGDFVGPPDPTPKQGAFKCATCEDGQIMPGGEMTCPACGADCLPF